MVALETAPASTRIALLWVLSSSGVTLFLIGIVALAGSPPGLTFVVDASLGLIGVAALFGADAHGRLDGRWLASRAAAWFFSIACVFAAATLIFTLVEWRSGSAPGVVSMVLATVVCGVLWNPLLRIVQRVSDGVLFGFRPDALTAAQRWRSASATTRAPLSERSRRARPAVRRTRYGWRRQDRGGHAH